MCDAEHAKCLLAQQLSDLLSDGMLPMLRDLASKTTCSAQILRHIHSWLRKTFELVGTILVGCGAEYFSLTVQQNNVMCLLQEHQTPNTSVHAHLSKEYDALQNRLLQCWPSHVGHT